MPRLQSSTFRVGLDALATFRRGMTNDVINNVLLRALIDQISLQGMPEGVKIKSHGSSFVDANFCQITIEPLGERVKLATIISVFFGKQSAILISGG